jgi:hypothetical protein
MPDDLDASRTWATLRIWGKALDPDMVTGQLGITPSTAFRAGDQRGKKKDAIWKEGHWDISSEGHVSSNVLQDHIEWLLDQLEPAQARLRILLTEDDVRADIFCFWEFATHNAGIVFSPLVMRRIAALNLELDLDIYFAGDDELKEEAKKYE